MRVTDSRRVPDPNFHIVLLHPEIPPNTGNVGRTAVATGCRLHIVKPIGFDMSGPARRRAGLDYWQHLDWREHDSWEAFVATEAPPRLWLYSTKASRTHWDADMRRGDYLLFGKESSGVGPEVHDWVAANWGDDHRLRLPLDPIARSLNLGCTVAVAVFEGLRQLHD